MFVDNGWSLPLGLGQDNIREVLAGGDHADLLKIVVRHLTDTTLTSVSNRYMELIQLMLTLLRTSLFHLLVHYYDFHQNI